MSTTYVELNSNSLGDTIASMPVFEEYRKTKEKLIVKINPIFEKLFKKSYPEIIFYRDNMSYDNHIVIHYDFNKPIQTGFAEQLGFDNWVYIRPKVDSFKKQRPIKNKYITMGIHSTMQLKYWNHPDGIKSQTSSSYWDQLSAMIRKEGYTPLILEKDEMFGVPPYRNGMPKKAQKKLGLPIEDLINHIEHSEFFVGISSGLSWLAHALGKPVVMIANFTNDWNEFDLSTEDYIRITNKNVCNGCWNKINTVLNFDPTEWYWCPYHKDTPRQFECHTSITPEMVFEQIKPWLKKT